MMRALAEPSFMLSVEKLEAGYDTARVLFGVDLAVEAAEVVTLLGRNGMGKTTLVKAIMGLLRPSGGTVSFEGRALTGAPPFRVAQAGIGLVPEGRQVFPTLTVEENLVATAASRFGPPRWTLDTRREPVSAPRRTPPPSRLAALRAASSKCSPSGAP